MRSKKIFKSFKNYWQIFLILLIIGVLFLARADKGYLEDWDECIYAQYAREMKNTGQLLTYQWNGNFIFEKAPLYGLLMQIPYFFGVNEFTSRFLSVIFGMILLIFMYFFVQRNFSKLTALMSITILLTSQAFIQAMYKVNTDIGFILYSFLGFYFWEESIKKPKYIYLSGFFYALAALHKGLIILFYLFAIFVTLFTHKKRIIYINYIKVICIFLVFILPWHIYQILVHGNDFIQVYFIDNLLIRSTYSIFPEKTLFFYFKEIHYNFFPWYVSIIFFVFTITIKFFITRYRNISYKREILDVSILLVVVFVLLSIVRTKINIYIMPLYPLLAVLMAYCFDVGFVNKKILNKIKLLEFFYALILFHALLTVINETIFVKDITYAQTSYDAFMHINNYSHKDLEYLVDPYYRSIKKSPGVKKTIPAQFAYGEKPCVAFYTNKHINLYYSINDFKHKIINSNSKGLFLINKNDEYLINHLLLNVLYKNNGYIIFEN
jgi:4-amino-4-deoxy-L-arabinose transferase-like glycosyltransferase